MVADVPKAAIFTHDDLDAIFLNIEVITKVNDKFLGELQSGVQPVEAISAAAKKFKGCYTRYVNNFDSAEAKLRKIRQSNEPLDREKQRYLNTATSHPDARGKDVTSFLIQPVQRVLRYRLLLADLLKHTEEGHPDEAAVKDALERVSELARIFNEDKRQTDEFAKLRAVFSKFVDSDATSLQNELLSYERKILKEGKLIKARLSRRQLRVLFLFNDVLLYAAPTMKGCVLKGRIKLHDGARVESLPSTEEMPHALAIVERGGKGYTWLCESAEEKESWFSAMSSAMQAGMAQARVSQGFGVLANLPSKSREERLEAVRTGGTLTKYNKSDGKSKLRYVCVVRSHAGDKICWADKQADVGQHLLGRHQAKLGEATALMHGAKSSNFYKQQGSKQDEDWACFSIVFKERTLDFAATSAASLLDWYLALAALIPQSTEPLLDEPTLRQRMESQGVNSSAAAAGA